MSRTYVVDLRLTVTVDDPGAVDAESWDEVVPFIEKLVHEDLEGDPIDEDGMSVRFKLMSLEEVDGDQGLPVASTAPCDPPTIYTYEVVDRVNDVILAWQRRLSETYPVMSASRKMICDFLGDLERIKDGLEGVDRG